MVNYPLGHMATMLAASRYIGEYRKLMDEPKETDAEKSNAVLASTYLLGLYDMAMLCHGVSNGESAADHLRRIDAKVMGFKAGQYAEGGE